MRSEKRTKFIRTVKNFYRRHGRHELPWRNTTDPYRIAVSEVMLQQTQVSRVIEKYTAFLKEFPTIEALAAAPLSRVLGAWSGLGYNRRAKFLHQMAREVAATYGGTIPRSIDQLESLPGIGPYTARAIAAFAYNNPSAFIETNIRTVYLHHFFPTKTTVSDKALLSIVEATLDAKNPRAWYAALMDYGSFLKTQGSTVHRSSAQYKKQSPFAGSRRQVRGAVIKTLLAAPQPLARIARTMALPLPLVASVVRDLAAEKMLVKQGQKYALAR